jgi:hypothetical protein
MAAPNEHHGDEYGEERSPWSKPSVMLSGMFVLALLLGGIAFVIFNGGNSTHHTHTGASATSGATASATTATTTPAASTGRCSLPAGNQSIPSGSPPSGTHWATVGSIQVPQAPSVYGPQRTSGVFYTCFAHNPAGALLAAINLWAEGSTIATPSEVFERLAVGAPKNLGSSSNLITAAGGSVQLAGYKYDSYTATDAAVSVVLQGAQGKLVAIVTPMRWTGSDWKYVFPANGVPSFQAVPDLSGYVPWSEF